MVFPFLKPKPKPKVAVTRPRPGSPGLPTVMVGSVGAAPRTAPVADDASRQQMYKQLRRPPTATELRVSDVAMAWLLTLPKELRPLECCQRYPHVVNHLAGWWDNADGLDAYFADLLHGTRKRRAGFPAPVKREIDALFAYADSRGLVKASDGPLLPVGKAEPQR